MVIAASATRAPRRTVDINIRFNTYKSASVASFATTHSGLPITTRLSLIRKLVEDMTEAAKICWRYRVGWSYALPIES